MLHVENKRAGVLMGRGVLGLVVSVAVKCLCDRCIKWLKCGSRLSHSLIEIG